MSQSRRNALGIGFAALMLLAAFGLGQGAERPATVDLQQGQTRGAADANDIAWQADEVQPRDGEAPFDLKVVEDKNRHGDLAYRIEVGNRFLGPEPDSDSASDQIAVESGIGAFKVAYHFACDPTQALLEPGFCDVLARDVHEGEVFELSLFERTSQLVESPAALADAFYVLRVTVAGSSGADGEAAVLIDESHFFSRDGRAVPLTIGQYYERSGANQAHGSGGAELVSVRPGDVDFIDAVDPTFTLEAR